MSPAIPPGFDDREAETVRDLFPAVADVNTRHTPDRSATAAALGAMGPT